MGNIRLCRDSDREDVLAIINSAALAYRGVIPADRWHEPYMAAAELDDEIAAGVLFWGYELDDKLVGVMGLQSVRDVDLIRHAYVLPGSQRHGVGGALLSHLRERSTQRMLVGTWAAAEWAIRFYQQHGFIVVSPTRKVELLKAYWTIPDRQIETSVVLADGRDDEGRGTVGLEAGGTADREAGERLAHNPASAKRCVENAYRVLWRPRCGPPRHGELRPLSLFVDVSGIALKERQGHQETSLFPEASAPSVSRFAQAYVICDPIGRRRMRLPVAAKIALQSAGANGGTPGSPTPLDGTSMPFSTICVFVKGGDSSMRITW